MALPSRSLLLVALLALACGQTSGGAKTTGTTGDGAAPPPGQEAGPPGTRGGGGGAFGGGNDPDADALDALAPTPDGPLTMADATAGADLPRDTHFTPVDAVSLADTGTPADSSADLCGGTCDGYETDYKAALVRARTCLPTSKLQCQMTAATGLRCAGCKIWVTSTTELADIRAKWLAAGCQACKVLCSDVACRALTTGICHSKMLAAPQPDPIVAPPLQTGTCLDQSDPVPF